MNGLFILLIYSLEKKMSMFFKNKISFIVLKHFKEMHLEHIYTNIYTSKQ